jgi:hypothetical protein
VAATVAVVDRALRAVPVLAELAEEVQLLY